MSLSDDDRAFLREAFAAEAPHHIERMRGAVVSLEAKPDAEVQSVLLRAVHSLRGDAAMVGMTALAERLGAAEEILFQARAEQRLIERELLAGYGRLGQALGASLPAIVAGEATIDDDLLAAFEFIKEAALVDE